MPDFVIESKNLSFSVPSRQILKDISFQVAQGSFTVVVGENGAGKTTLLQLLMGLVEPTRGLVLVNGKRPDQDPYEDRQSLGYIAEKITPPVDWSIDEFLKFNRYFYKNYSTDFENTLIRELKLAREWRIGALSAGQVRRAQVVGVLSSSPKVLIVDEITAVLDIVGRAKFMRALHRLRQENGCTVLMATNILDDVDTYATDVILLHRGQLTEKNTKENLMRSSREKTLTDALSALIEKAEEVDV